jgi:hypothetical protein
MPSTTIDQSLFDSIPDSIEAFRMFLRLSLHAFLRSDSAGQITTDSMTDPRHR